ncbi:MAG: hypothetical protein ABI723_27005 [Bacteroidia bacterium]
MTDENLPQSVLEVCKALNKYSVAYLIVGGVAVAFHGYYRDTTNSAGANTDKDDIDIWYNPTYSNYYKLLRALEHLGQNVSDFRNEKSPNPKKSYFKFEFEKFTVDFLPEIKGLNNFNAAYKKRETSNINGIEIHLISYSDIITSKSISPRKKDILDIEQLESKPRKK